MCTVRCTIRVIWHCRYGYMEVVRQDERFVRELLGRVLHLLYKTLQERASKMPTLVKDLGLPAGTELPVSLHILPCPLYVESASSYAANGRQSTSF